MTNYCCVSHQVIWTWRGSSWLMATQSVWIGCVSATTTVRRWSWRRRPTWRPRSVCCDSSCRSCLSLLYQQRYRDTYCSYTKVCDGDLSYPRLMLLPGFLPSLTPPPFLSSPKQMMVETRQNKLFPNMHLNNLCVLFVY